MARLLMLDAKTRQTVEAPNWVAKAYDGAAPLGAGSYARVFRCADGFALKLTNDVATIKLARHLSQAPTPGFYRARRICDLRKAPGPFMAVSMPILAPLSGWRRASIKRAYRQALLLACQDHGYPGDSLRGSRAFANAMANDASAPLCAFSASICLHLAQATRRNQEGLRLRAALVALAAFCESAVCDIDLMGLDNWMLDDHGRLVLNDPVVNKAYAF